MSFFNFFLRGRHAVLVLAAFVGAGAASQLCAQTSITWANAGTDFATGANWTGGVVPANDLTTNIALFSGSASSPLVLFTADQSLAGIEFTSTSGGFVFAPTDINFPVVLTLGSAGLTVGSSGNQAFFAGLNFRLGVSTSFDRGLETTIEGNVDTNGHVLTLLGEDSGGFGIITGAVGGSGGIVKSGANNWTLSGTNTYTGPTTVNGGTLLFAKPAAFYGGTSANWTAANLTVNNGSVAGFNVGGSGEFAAADLDIVKGLGTASGGFQSGSRLGIDTTNASGGTFTYASNIANPNGGANALGLEKLGSGTLVLSGVNTYTGPTVVSSGTLVLSGVSASPMILSGGTLKLGADGALSAGSAVSMSNGTSSISTFDLDGHAVTIGSLAGTGSVTLGSGSLVTGGDNTSTTFSGTISGTGSLTKTGSGLFVMGSASYTGATTISAGTLQFSGGQSLSASAVTIAGGATLDLGNLSVTVGSIAGSGSIILSGLLNMADNTSTTFSGTIYGTSALAKSGTGTTVLSGANSYSGGTTITNGTLRAGSNTAFGTGTITVTGGYIGANGAPVTLANALNIRDSANNVGDTVAMTFSGPVTLRANWAATAFSTGVTTFSGAIGEAGVARSFSKYGTGEVDFTGANTYTGGTLIGQGTLRINNTSGSAFGTGAVTVAAGATLTGAGTFSGALQVNGTYSPGNSPAFVSQPGDIAIGTTGLLAMQIGGLTRGTDYDALSVGGHFSEGGTLSVSLINGFVPANGQTFDLFDWGLRTGTFATISLPTLDSSLTWDTSALYTTGTLGVVVSAIPEPADAAMLGAIAALAFVAWRRRRVRN